MSMLQYPLYDFLATVPHCVETTTLAMVLEIVEQEQCDRLVILNQQQCPLGLVYSAQLTQKLLATSGDEQDDSLQQSIISWDPNIIEPLKTIPATYCVDQLRRLLSYQPTSTNHNLEWALIDTEGKFLGLLNNTRLLRLLAQEKLAVSKVGSLPASAPRNSQPMAANKRAKAHWRRRPHQYQPMENQPLVQLLELLPWPLMLQRGTGEVVAQNPAWWQQIGALKDPEGVKQQVEAILAPIRHKQPEYASQHNGGKYFPHMINDHDGADELAVTNDALLPKGLSPPTSYSASLLNNQHEQPAVTNSSIRCFLDGQSHTGSCTCIVEEQNGQERIWQFSKIPLDKPESELLLSEKSPVGLPSATPELNNHLWLVLATDITEQQQIYKELAAKNADLIQLNRLKDEFLACISHELKTPLTAVLGLSRLLVDQQLGELNERQARYAGLIHQSGRHLMSVVNDILDLTRMETGQMDLALTQVKIMAVCDRALSEAKAVHTQTTKATTTPPPVVRSYPEFTINIEPGLDQIVADELRLRQMLVHLLSNAFKFTENSGEIGLRVNRWEGWIAFTVWDTGIGIPEHQQHLIFQKFQQLENPLTRQFEGTGLGLVLTRALARLHGGDVSFLSREGKGSQFTLLLPPSPPTSNFSESEQVTESSSRSANPHTEVSTSTRQRVLSTTTHHPISSQRLVLVVEAVARYIEDLTEQLKGLGYRVVIARSGTEAVEKARRLQPKAIFLNPLLPLLSGWDVLTLLKSDEATRQIPVVVTATGAEKEQAFANRADGFLNLPVEHQFLVPLVEKLCAVPVIQPIETNHHEITPTQTPLRILRLVDPNLESINPHPSLREHRVIEVDDLDQAELLARVWQFDVILLDVASSQAQTYLEHLTQHPLLAELPLVTCDVKTTLKASQIPGLSVFPYLTPLNQEDNNRTDKSDPLLSVLQIASGVSCPPSILVVDLTMLRDFPQIKRKQSKNQRPGKNSSLSDDTTERGSEWFQALIQYLQTAGLKAAMGQCWAEVLQQIRHQSVDLLLICLGESSIPKEILTALKALENLPGNLPPILVIDQQLHQTPINSLPEITKAANIQQKNSNSSALASVIGGMVTQILPRSISMEDLLHQINRALAVNGH